MGDSNLEVSSVTNDIIRNLFSTLDKPAYWLLGLVYQLFFAPGIFIGTKRVIKTKEIATLLIKLVAPFFESVKVSGLTIPLIIVTAS